MHSKPATASAFSPIGTQRNGLRTGCFKRPRVGNRQKHWTRPFQGIAARYGTRTADFVAMQLEYPRHGGHHEDTAPGDAIGAAEDESLPQSE